MIGRRTFSLSSLAVVGTAVSARADTASLKFGTASEGSSFPLYGAAFVDLIRLIDPILSIRDVTTRGTSENLPKLETGELDLGLVTGEVLHEAFEGIGRPRTNIKVVAAAFPVPGMFAVTSTSRYRTITDLKGAAVVWNPRDSGLAIQARYVMDGLGLDLERDFQAIYPDEMKDGPTVVIDHRAAAIWGGGLRWPGFVALAESAQGSRFIAPTDDEVERIRAKHAFLAALTVPAGLYRGQREPISTVGSWSMLVARAELPDEIGRRIAAALGKAEHGQLLPRQLSQSTAKNTLAAVPDRDDLQPGVRQYYKDRGLL